MAFRVAYESSGLGNSGHSFDLTYDYECLVIELSARSSQRLKAHGLP
ncbi:hypothetical protein J2S48_000451 [Promicromonospora iranensis]|uniref:Uncharacterized protein n=1 Tax=Promicromonospora iranensis TaxID=1105144 RepID=A0ABU2CHX3_9MICO|nr:hypothetical protein [Promicromonospora iranensis]